MWDMFNKAYSGVKKLGRNVYSEMKNEYKYHKFALKDVHDKLLDMWSISKDYYKEKGKKANDNLGTIVALSTGTLGTFALYMGLTDGTEYELDIPLLSLSVSDYIKCALTLFGFSLGGFYLQRRENRRRGERELDKYEIEVLKGELETARKRQEEEYIKGMMGAGKQTRRMRDELAILRERLAKQDKKIGELMSDSKIQLELLEELSKEQAARKKGKKATN